MNNLQVTFQTLAIVLAMSIRTLVPTLVDSDHESDDDPRSVGYNDLDTDEEIDSTATEERVSRREGDESDWCTCGCCATMETEVKCYCCGESSLICETIIHETGKKCATEVNIFKKTIEDREILELQSKFQRGIITDSEGIIVPDSLRHTAYATFLQIGSLRSCGKGRRYILPSCVVERIRELYPSPDGNYTDFQPGTFNSRV